MQNGNSKIRMISEQGDLSLWDQPVNLQEQNKLEEEGFFKKEDTKEKKTK